LDEKRDLREKERAGTITDREEYRLAYVTDAQGFLMKHMSKYIEIYFLTN
jgi:hypothetical protein